MRIAFIASTLDLGKDGIADYTNRLSGCCREHGVECRTFPFGKWNTPFDHKDYTKFVADLKARLSDYQPDIISWQYDGNLFSPRRIYPRFVVPDFSGITPSIHLMVHETWEGNYRGVPLSKSIKGILQKQCLKGFIKKVQASRVHTSIDLYRSMLRHIGVETGLLPMFSTIPVATGTQFECDYTSQEWHFAFFGGVYEYSRYQELIEKLAATGRKCIFHHVGRILDRSNWENFKQIIGENHECVDHGSCPDSKVSAILSKCHFGISTMPRILLGKSTVHCAFREHGLPIIDIRLPLVARGYSNSESSMDDNLIDLDNLPNALIGIQRHKPAQLLHRTAEIFLCEMESMLKEASLIIRQ